MQSKHTVCHPVKQAQGGTAGEALVPDGRIHKDIETQAYLDKTPAAGVNYNPGVGFSPSGATGKDSMRLAYGYPLLHTIEEGIKRLAKVLSV